MVPNKWMNYFQQPMDFIFIVVSSGKFLWRVMNTFRLGPKHDVMTNFREVHM